MHKLTAANLGHDRTKENNQNSTIKHAEFPIDILQNENMGVLQPYRCRHFSV